MSLPKHVEFTNVIVLKLGSTPRVCINLTASYSFDMVKLKKVILNSKTANITVGEWKIYKQNTGIN